MRPAQAEGDRETADAGWRDEPALSLASEDRIELLEIVARLAAWWRVGLVTAIVVFAIGGVLIVRLHSMYVAGSSVLPRDSATPTNSLAAFFTGARPSAGLMPLLTSRSLEDDVVRRTGLMQSLGITNPEAALGTLHEMRKFVPGADGVITILVRSTDAHQAQTMANAYIDALRAMQERMAETQSDVQLHVYQQQLQKERDALAAAEGELERAEVGSGVVQAETQTQTGLAQIAQTQSQINTLQVQLAALLQGSTEQNPEVRRLRSQIAQLQAQERSQEAGSGRTAAGAAAPAGRLPEVNLLISRKQREVRYREQLVSNLATHFDSIRLNEASLNDNFDVLDRALLPMAPTWPPRGAYFALLAVGSLFLGLVAMLAAIVVDRILVSPVQREWLREIARNVRRPRHGGGVGAR